MKGRIGDEINALVASCGFKLKKLLKLLKAFLSLLITSLIFVYLIPDNKNQARIFRFSIAGAVFQ